MTLTRMLRLPQACEATGRKPGAHYLDIKKGVMVPGVRIGPNASAWPAHEIEAINRAKIAGASEEQIHELVKRLVSERTETAAA
jgi:prophage regulatory protein